MITNNEIKSQDLLRLVMKLSLFWEFTFPQGFDDNAAL